MTLVFNDDHNEAENDDDDDDDVCEAGFGHLAASCDSSVSGVDLAVPSFLPFSARGRWCRYLRLPFLLFASLVLEF